MKKLAYYNEYDPKAATWLRALIDQKTIPNGIVDERSILEVRPEDVAGFNQVQWFAGIAGWAEALQLAGWPTNRPVWCASLPCQPFSAAGKQKGASDDRHLWPAFFNLVRECRPECIFGEQVAAAIGFDWLDGISADLEAEGYRVGAVVLGAHSVGAPQRRQRLYWVADCYRGQSGRRPSKASGEGQEIRIRSGHDFGHGGENGFAVGDTGSNGSASGILEPSQWEERLSGKPIDSSDRGNFWGEYQIIQTTDGKARRIPAKSSVQLLADGIQAGMDAGWLQGDGTVFPLAQNIKGRVGLLKGFGNAIVPQVAAQFIQAYLETL